MLIHLHAIDPNASQLMTGIEGLDEVLGGLRPGELTVIGGRPAMGKTALAVAIASELALRAKKSVGYFSLELTNDRLVNRLISREGGVSLVKLRNDQLSEENLENLCQAVTKFSQSNLYIDQQTSLSAHDISMAVTKMVKLDLVIIDYLQIMNGCNRHEEMNNTLKVLKGLAVDLKIPIIAFSQLDRSNNGKADLTSFRTIKNFENVDNVLFINRPGYYDRLSKNHKIEFSSLKPGILKTATQDFRDILIRANG